MMVTLEAIGYAIALWFGFSLTAGGLWCLVVWLVGRRRTARAVRAFNEWLAS